jgi:hypothetical protein
MCGREGRAGVLCICHLIPYQLNYPLTFKYHDGVTRELPKDTVVYCEGRMTPWAYRTDHRLNNWHEFKPGYYPNGRVLFVDPDNRYISIECGCVTDLMELGIVTRLEKEYVKRNTTSAVHGSNST